MECISCGSVATAPTPVDRIQEWESQKELD
jgi:hypothetical protein